MTPGVRFMAALGMVIVAMDCFAKDGGELGLPYWVWAVCGVVWLLNAPRLFMRELS